MCEFHFIPIKFYK